MAQVDNNPGGGGELGTDCLKKKIDRMDNSRGALHVHSCCAPITTAAIPMDKANRERDTAIE